MYEIVMIAKGRGRFKACWGDRVLHNNTRQPLLDCARILLAEGVDPLARISTRHDWARYPALASTVGEAAKWTVAERDRGGGPYFELWKAGQEFAEAS